MAADGIEKDEIVAVERGGIAREPPGFQALKSVVANVPPSARDLLRREVLELEKAQDGGGENRQIPPPVPHALGQARGNPAQSSRTVSRAEAAAPSSVGASRTRAIAPPITSISSGPMPRVVTAGVPMRMPDATIGGRVSK